MWFPATGTDDGEVGLFARAGIDDMAPSLAIKALRRRRYMRTDVALAAADGDAEIHGVAKTLDVVEDNEK